MKAQKFVVFAIVALGAAMPAARASFVFSPSFDSSITTNANAAAIEGAINAAIATFEGLYGNTVTVPVTFTYDSAGGGNLLSTNQLEYSESYAQYKAQLQADAAAHPGNTVLAAAIANLGSGNDSSGSGDMALTSAQLNMLTGSSLAGDITININSDQTFDFSRPVNPGDFDLIGGLEHELDEVLGGGGAGSTLNSIAGSCVTTPTGFFCNKFGALDLYRYSAPNTPSFTTSGSATSYFSIDGGTTVIVGFNQNSGGDFADFGPPGAGPGQLIQNAFNDTGQDEAYTTSSPEFAMLESIGWDASQAAPEPTTMALFGVSLLGLAALRRRS